MFYWYFPLNSGFIPEGTADLTSYVKDVGIHFGNKKVYTLNNVILLLWLIYGNSWIKMWCPNTILWRPQCTFLREKLMLFYPYLSDSTLIIIIYYYLDTVHLCISSAFLFFFETRKKLCKFSLFHPPTSTPTYSLENNNSYKFLFFWLLVSRSSGCGTWFDERRHT